MKKTLIALLLLPVIVIAQTARKDVSAEIGAKLGIDGIVNQSKIDTRGYFNAQFETGGYQKKFSFMSGLSSTGNKSNLFRFFYTGVGYYILRDKPEDVNVNVMPFITAGYMYTTKKVLEKKDDYGQELLLTSKGFGYRTGLRFVFYGNPEKQGYGGFQDCYLNIAYNAGINPNSEHSFLIGLGIYIRNN